VSSIGQAAPQESGKTTVSICRQKKYGGSALEPSVYLDDKRIAGMDNGRHFALTVDPDDLTRSFQVDES
jgi:hypothetical protein